jgi:hypothetical protein
LTPWGDGATIRGTTDTTSGGDVSTSVDDGETTPRAASAPIDPWDPGTPPELVPTTDIHPNQRAYYQRLVLDKFLDPPAPSIDPGIPEIALIDPSNALTRWRHAAVATPQPAAVGGAEDRVASGRGLRGLRGPGDAGLHRIRAG